MRILHIAATYARSEGGPSEVLQQLLPVQNRLHDVTLLTTDKNVEPSESPPDCNIVITAAGRPTRWSFSPGFPAAAHRLVRDADVVHVHGMNTFTGSVAMQIAVGYSKPIVLQPHGSMNVYHQRHNSLVKALYDHTLDRRGFARAAAVVVSSELEATGVKRVFDKAVVANVPLGVHDSLFSVQRQRCSQPYVLFLSRVAKKKRLDLVLHALADRRLASRNMRLAIAGPIEESLGYDPRRLADDLGISARVDWIGVAGPEKRAALLSRASAFVLPSEDESFGVAVAEALAAGCPVVASPHVGIAPGAALEDSLVLCGLNGESIADALVDVLSRPDAEALSSRARAYAQSNFSWTAAADKLASIYEAVAAK